MSATNPNSESTAAGVSSPRVVVGVATYRRAECLRRLFRCLELQTLPVVAVVVADNGAEAAIRAMCEDSPVKVRYLGCPENRGCGDALYAAEEWLERSGMEWDYFWVLDDDAVPPPDAAALLVLAIVQSGAGMAVPFLTDARGHVWGFPEPLDAVQRREIRETEDPSELLARMGPGPHRACWTTGACQMISRATLASAGKHRRDFWLLGEDIEFSMRIAATSGVVFLPTLLVPHLPPPAPDPANAGAVGSSGYRKFCALLQNLAYISFHIPHRFHMRSYLAGNAKRFASTYHFSPRAFVALVRCLWSGAVLGRPYGWAFGVGPDQMDPSDRSARHRIKEGEEPTARP